MTYQYQPANLHAAITEAYPLPVDSDVYCSGAATTNRGAANGQSTARVQFVDENGNDLWALSHAEPNPYTSTGDYETPYDFSSAETETAFQINGLTYAFSKDYDGTFDTGKDDEDVAYTGTLQPGGRTITRVYTAEAQTLTVTKLYDIDTLPGAFQVTITDNDANQAHISVLTLADTTVNGHTATWQTALPKGHSYTFTESGFSNGTSWSTELPVIDLPDEEAPMADAPKTGDSTGEHGFWLPAYPAWLWSGWLSPGKSAVTVIIRHNEKISGTQPPDQKTK